MNLYEQHCSSGGTAGEPVDTGPARVAVLVRNGRRVKIGKVLECCEHARERGLIGATVTLLDGTLCATIEGWSWDRLVGVGKACEANPTAYGYDYSTVREEVLHDLETVR